MRNPFRILYRMLAEFFDPLKRPVLPESSASSKPFSLTITMWSGLSRCIGDYRSAIPGSPEESQALARVSKMAVSFSDWLEVLEGISPHTDLGKLAIERLLAIATDTDDWSELLERVNKDTALEYLRQECMSNLRKSVAYATSLSAVIDTYDGLDSDSLLIAPLMEMLAKCTEPFSDWCDAYNDRSDVDDFSDALLKRALALVQTPDEWIRLWAVAENACTEDLDIVREAFGRIAWNKEAWEQLRNNSEDGSELEVAGLKGMIGLLGTATDAVEFYLDYIDRWIEDDEVLEALHERILALATPGETKIIALVAEQDGLREAAQKKLDTQ